MPTPPPDIAPRSDFEALALDIVDILVRSGFLTSVYFSFLIELMLALLSYRLTLGVKELVLRDEEVI